MDTVHDRIAFVRKGMGLSQEEFARIVSDELAAAGLPRVTRGAIGNWEASKKPATANLDAVGEVTGTTMDWLIRGRGPQPAETELRRRGDRFKATVALKTLNVAPEQIRMPMTVNVFGQAAGATLANGSTILFDQAPIGTLPLLPGLVGIRDIYGLEVTGDSMKDRFAPGDPVYVSPSLPVAKDDAAIIIERASSRGNPTAFIKLFVADRGDRVITRQLNPPHSIEFLKAPGLEVHRVLTMKEALGYSGGAEVMSQVERPSFRRKKR